MSESTQLSIPKAVLYVDSDHAWSIAEEKGYGSDEISVKFVDLSKGESYAPTFLRLNPLGTLPTLIVPFENTLAPDTEARYKAVTDVETIITTLDRSRSATSRTRTTSSAPSPSLSPATIELSSLARTIIQLLHSGPASPELLFFMNARNDAELKGVAATVRPFLEGRKEALDGFLSQNATNEVRASQKTRKFWEDKKEAAERLLAVFVTADKSEAELDETDKKVRAEYYENSKAAWEVGLGLVLTKLSAEMRGPFALGDQFSIADVHLSGWLRYVVKLAGGSGGDSGADAIGKLEGHVGGGFALPRISNSAAGTSAQATAAGPETTTPKASDEKAPTTTKLEAFWDNVKERGSWKAM
ncbi:hypothetical protein K488DRAFT_78322 [Vararia minispora EC-137]|uniref:Uncharacterized protein n=1 Tax=Vararia minispora EC-137 TaxID=1314806 RepID=A0ACB8QM23_9AGAM|nr:hypothetical protein K488DRAFT_78322 [Vararia minispora EC-137]